MRRSGPPAFGRRQRFRAPNRGLGDRSARVLAAILVLLAAGGGLAGQERAPGGSARCGDVLPTDLRAICERGELRVVRYGGARPPFFVLRDGEWVGFDVDLARDMAARLGVAYVEDSSAGSFDEVVDRVASGAADVGISKLSGTLERAMRVRFSKPYLTVYQALLVNRLSLPGGGDPFASLDADRFTIGALAGSAYVGYAESSFAAAEVQPYDDFATMMRDVVDGGLDAALMDSARANTWRRSNSQRLIQVRTSIDKRRRDPLAIAVGWENTHLLAWVNLYLDQIRADGTAERLYRRWFVKGDAAEPVTGSTSR